MTAAFLTAFLAAFLTAFFTAAFLAAGFFAAAGFGVSATFAASIAAHRLRAASAMARLPAALNLRFRFAGSGGAALSTGPPFSCLAKFRDLLVYLFLLRFKPRNSGGDDLIRDFACHTFSLGSLSGIILPHIVGVRYQIISARGISPGEGSGITRVTQSATDCGVGTTRPPVENTPAHSPGHNST